MLRTSTSDVLIGESVMLWSHSRSTDWAWQLLGNGANSKVVLTKPDGTEYEYTLVKAVKCNLCGRPEEATTSRTECAACLEPLPVMTA